MCTNVSRIIFSSLLLHIRFYAMKSLRKAAKPLVTGRYLQLTELCTHKAELCQAVNILIVTSALIMCPYSPYDGKWSKTMVGFGPEDDHFVAELTYNYGVGEYQLGNDFLVGESHMETYNGNIGCSSLVKVYCHVCFHFRGSLCSRAKL